MGRKRCNPMEIPMTTALTRNRLLPLYVGGAVLAVFEVYAGFVLVDEGAAEFAQQAMLIAAPLLSLPLMYLALTSQK